MRGQIEWVSLYDYLGRPAGSELGEKVYKVAKSLAIPTQTRHVTTRKYTGDVILYPKSFVDLYFQVYAEGKVIDL